MVTCKCINKFRDTHNIIIGYRLKDTTGKCIDVTPDQVKVAIKNNQIAVTNLTLTSDGRLVEHKENNTIAKSTGNTFILKADGTWQERAETLKQIKGLWEPLTYSDIISNSSKFQNLVKICCETAILTGTTVLEIYYADSVDWNNSTRIKIHVEKDKIILYKGYGGLKTLFETELPNYATLCKKVGPEVEKLGNEYLKSKYIYVYGGFGYKNGYQPVICKDKLNNTKNPFFKQASLEEELKELATDDYQHRGGNYPRSGKPDTIQVYGTEIEADFKNTSESTAIKWLTDYLDRKGYKFKKVTACQTGDYDDDWVNASTTVTGRK